MFFADHLLAVIAKNHFRSRVEGLDAATVIGDEMPIGHKFDSCRVPRFRRLEFLFDPLAFSDVVYGGNERAVAGCGGILQQDFDGIQGAIGTFVCRLESKLTLVTRA